jgi:anaerobic magnesium-protoporphyrin IX monomethyl ester cyclase
MILQISKKKGRSFKRMCPRVLLIFESPKKRKLYANTLPPLGLLGLASYLLKHGVFVEVIDRSIEPEKTFDPFCYDVIGFSINMANIASSLESIHEVKRRNPGIKVIVGGPSCISSSRHFTCDEDIDAVCEGEGEESLLEYVESLGRSSCQPIAGLHLRTKEGGLVYGGKRKYIRNLDELPFPAFDATSLRKYNVPMRQRSPISSIVTSRGCPFPCIFCFHSMGHEWRARSCENVVDEIEWQINTLGVREICILDDNFSLDPVRAERICDLILKRGIKARFQLANGVRADTLTPALLRKMAKTGFWLLGIAPETGSLKIHKEIKKNSDHGKFEKVVQWCREIGINTYAFFMIGFPFESMEDIQQTASFVEVLDADFIQLSRVMATPGTPLYELVGADDAEFVREKGYFFDTPKFRPVGVSEEQVARVIKRIHQKFYLNFRRLRRLTGILPLRQLIELFIYSLRTKNI